MQKRIYNIEKLRGVDLSSSPINVASNRASYMVNMISRGGINVKRNGWRTEHKFELDCPLINGMYRYDDYVVVHVGSSFYKFALFEDLSIDFTSSEKIAVKDGTTVPNAKSRAYAQEGKLWIVIAAPTPTKEQSGEPLGGEYLVYDGEVVQTVIGSEYAYVPTTSIGITCEADGDKREAFQGVNLFTKKRINKLIGAEGNKNIYKLDGLVNMDKDVTVKIEASCFEEKNPFTPTADNLSNYLIVEQKNNVNVDKVHAMLTGADYSGEVTEAGVTIRFKNPVRIHDYASLDIEEGYADGEKPEITIETEDTVIDTILSTENGEYLRELLDEKTVKSITLDKYAKITKLVIKGFRRFEKKYKVTLPLPSVGGEDNLKMGTGRVKLPSPNTDEEIDIVLEMSLQNDTKEGCGVLEVDFPCPPVLEGESNLTVTYVADYESDVSISTSATVDLSASANILCLTNHKNIIYFSDYLFGYGYFPDNDYIAIGEESEPITAIVKLDGYVGVFKDNEFYKISIGTESIDEKYIIRIYPSLQGHYSGIGCENEFVALNVNGDTLIYNQNGVSGVISSEYKPVNMRSTNVNSEICEYSAQKRRQAFAVGYEGRYYLFIDGKVYIADTRYMTYESERLDTGYEYEWWVWDNCPCRLAYTLGDKLYMGTESGEIRCFYDGYKDVIEASATADSNQIIYDGEAFTFSDELMVEAGDFITVKNAKVKLNRDAIATSKAYLEANSIYLTLSQEDFKMLYPSVLSEGLKIQLYNGSYGSLDCTVSRIGTDNRATLKINAGTYNSAANYQIAKSSDEEALEARLRSDGRWDLINMLGEVARFLDYGSISIVLDRDMAVRCELRTGALNFAPMYAKTLYKLSFTPTRETRGDITLGYRTNLSDTDYTRRVSSEFDFLSYDFKDFTFEGGFYKSYVRRVLERNFNYIMFRLEHNTPGPFGIENAQVVYSINNEIRSDI